MEEEFLGIAELFNAIEMPLEFDDVAKTREARATPAEMRVAPEPS
jgi:hypothetical protein